MQLGIVIPVYLSHELHVQFTQEALESIQSSHRLSISVVDNYHSDAFSSDLARLENDRTTVLKNPQGNSLSAAWNLGIERSFSAGAAFVLVMNNDIVLHPQALDNLVLFAEKHPEFLLYSGTEWPNLRTLKQSEWDGSFAEHPHFSCFMVKPETVSLIGYFDEAIDGAYFEDNDYHTRILLAGKKAVATTTSKFYHYGSRTVEIDDELKLQIKPRYEKNRAYMQRKWGIDFQTESFSPPEKILEKCFSTPFNR